MVKHDSQIDRQINANRLWDTSWCIEEAPRCTENEQWQTWKRTWGIDVLEMAGLLVQCAGSSVEKVEHFNKHGPNRECSRSKYVYMYIYIYISILRRRLTPQLNARQIFQQNVQLHWSNIIIDGGFLRGPIGLYLRWNVPNFPHFHRLFGNQLWQWWHI